MTTFAIRAASAGDAHAIATIQVEAYRAAYAAILPPKYLDAITVERRTAVWKQLITDIGATEQIIVGADGRQIRAYAHSSRSRDQDAAATTGELCSVYVAPEHWRRGLGQLLLAESVRWFRANAFETATLWVLTANMPARRFYERFGWTADGAEKRAAERVEARYRLDLAARQQDLAGSARMD